MKSQLDFAVGFLKQRLEDITRKLMQMDPEDSSTDLQFAYLEGKRDMLIELLGEDSQDSIGLFDVHREMVLGRSR